MIPSQIHLHDISSCAYYWERLIDWLPCGSLTSWQAWAYHKAIPCIFTPHWHFTHFTQLLFLLSAVSACFYTFSAFVPDFTLFHTISHLTFPPSCLTFPPHASHAVITPHSCLTVSHLYSLHAIFTHPLPLYFPFTNAFWTLNYFCSIYLFNFELFWINSLILHTWSFFLNLFCILIQFILHLFWFLAFSPLFAAFLHFLEFFAIFPIFSRLCTSFALLCTSSALHTSLLKTFAYIWR